MRIAAVADVHSPRYLTEFINALSECSRPDLFLLAGDMVSYGQYLEYNNVIEAITSELGNDIQIVACFGNEEHGEVRQDILSLVENRIVFLDESITKIQLNDSTLGIVGTSTLVSNHEASETKDIEEVFEMRAEYLSKLLCQAAESSTHSILLMHYNPIDEKDSSSFSWWISRAFEEIQPDFIVHGHIHNPVNYEVTIGRTSIINVAFPARGKITELVI